MGADRALAALGGSKVIIERCKTLLARRKDLDDVTARQLQKLLLSAAEAPAPSPRWWPRRVEAEARQAALQDGYTFCLQPKAGNGGGCARTTTANDIDNTLVKSRDLAERQRVWTVSKEIGRPLKPGLVELQQLRNQVARELGHSSFFGLQVADYGMTVKEMMELLDATLATTKPLYQGLHCWAKYTLAKRFNRPVPKLLPAHWLGNRWAQRWPDLVEGTSLDQYFKGAKPETIVKSAENLLHLAGLPAPAGVVLDEVRPLSGAPGTAAQEEQPCLRLAHRPRAGRPVVDERGIQRAMVRHRSSRAGTHLLFPGVQPPRGSARPARRCQSRFPRSGRRAGATGRQQTPYLHKVGVLPANVNPDAHAWLLQSALDAMVFLPFSAGTMSHFERDLYEGGAAFRRLAEALVGLRRALPRGQPPRRSPAPGRWLRRLHQDAHQRRPGQYYDYALAWLIKFQLHDHICTKILKQDVRACDYSGRRRWEISCAASCRWAPPGTGAPVIKEATGEEISPRAMMAFYAPLVDDLAKQNAGQDCSR